MDKLKKLKGILRKCGSILIAYSGGIDSTLLLKVAADCLGNKVLAVTATSLTYPTEELISAKRLAAKLKVRHQVIKTKELNNPDFYRNSIKRCYFCKRELFRRLRGIARKNKIRCVADASNFSDKKDFRPGNQAKKEFRICSPLEEAGFTKDEVRSLSRRLKIQIWDKPSLACLASRLPYGTKITAVVLRQIHEAEKFLRKLKFREVRVRHYGDLCRIEVGSAEIPRLIKRRRQVVRNFKRCGYRYVTMDLEGYRSGSMNLLKT